VRNTGTKTMHALYRIQPLITPPSVFVKYHSAGTTIAEDLVLSDSTPKIAYILIYYSNSMSRDIDHRFWVGWPAVLGSACTKGQDLSEVPSHTLCFSRFRVPGF
jgi:hypothetical protein